MPSSKMLEDRLDESAAEFAETQFNTTPTRTTSTTASGIAITVR